MERIVKFMPAIDERNQDPDKDYGIHGVDLIMMLKGSEGAVQFVLHTNWHLPKVQKELINEVVDMNDKMLLKAVLMPSPADLGYYTLERKHSNQYYIESCPYFDGKPCYYDGSGLNARRIYNVLLEEGSDGVWRELEKYYNEIFY